MNLTSHTLKRTGHGLVTLAIVLASLLVVSSPGQAQTDTNPNRTALENELIVASRDLDTNRATVRASEGRIQQATTAIAEGETLTAQLDGRVGLLTGERDTLQANLDETLASSEQLDQTIEAAEAGIDEATEELDRNQTERVEPERTTRALAVRLYIDGTASLNTIFDELVTGEFGIEPHRDHELVLAVSDASVGRLRVLNTERASLADEQATLRATISTSHTERRAAKAVLETTSADLAATEEKLASATSELTAATDTLTAARTELESATRDQTEAFDAISRLEARVIELTERLAGLPARAVEPATGPANSVEGTPVPDTGRPVRFPPVKPGNLDRPALAIKIDNSSRARPQTGLGLAEVVFEEMVEGGISRYIAVYRSWDAPVVGPVRSARTSDLDILANLNRPLFANSGGNRKVLDALAGTDLVNVNVAKAGGAYFRSPNRRTPHNLYTRPTTLRSSGAARPAGLMPELFTFRRPGESLAASARSIGGVDIRFGATRATYVWDDALGGWQRSTDGVTAVDAADGEPLAPENVIVQFTRYGQSAADSRSPEAISVGSGEAWFMFEGRLVEGRWSRATAESPTVYTDASGSAVRLSPGRTWISLAPPNSASIQR